MSPYSFPVFKIPPEFRFWIRFLHAVSPKGVMVNSSILGRWPKRNVLLEKGIHGFLRFKGAIFADSGGFSVKSLGWTQEDLFDFQRRIKPNLVTTLDHPVDLTKVWAHRERMVCSTRNAEMVRGKSRADRFVLLASVHGATTDELQNAILRLERLGIFDGYAVGSALTLSSDYFRLMRLVLAARIAAGTKHLHVYGTAGQSLHLLMFFLGVDTVDSQGFLLSAGNGKFFMADGEIYRRKSREKVSCYCRFCRGRSPATMPRERIAYHNFEQIQNDLTIAHSAIRKGWYREFLKSRFRALPQHRRALTFATSLLRRVV
jgi:7-cyano-7-deazaguanine tRNA-ribosyltransferase